MTLILLINDDGIKSVGLLAMKRALDDLGDVFVIAPERERSGIGKAITCGGQVRVYDAALLDGSHAYAITGTPADAFMIAVRKLLGRRPDLLVSGINLGPNLGIDDLLNSGTLGAALEAAIHGVPAVAVSYCMSVTASGDEKRRVTLEELEATVEVARRVVRYVLERGMPEGVDIISINVPRGARLGNVKATSLSYKSYGDIYVKTGDGYHISGWALDMYPDDEPGTDIHAVKVEGAISITPICLRLQHNLDALKGMLEQLFGGARDVGD